MSIKEPTGKLARWALCLQEFDIDISYRPGKANQNADCLSRIPVPNSDDRTPPEENSPVIFLMTKDFLTEQAKDKYCTSAREKYLIAKGKHETQESERSRHEVAGRLMKYSPRRSRSGSSSSMEDDSDEDSHEFIELHNGLMGTPHGQILVPEPLRLKILQRFHDSLYAGH